MKYFLRFTSTPEEDLEIGISMLEIIPGLDEPVPLKGLFGYSFFNQEDLDYDMITEEEIELKVKKYRKNLYHPGTPVIFQGEYIESNYDGNGVVFKPIDIYKFFNYV